MNAEHPFAPAAARESWFANDALRDVLHRLAEGLGERESFLVLVGEPGTGKTALVHEAIASLGDRIAPAPLAAPAIAGGELLEELVRRLGGAPPDGASRSKLVACLEEALAAVAARGQVAFVVVDDAHDLAAERLEELRLLANTAQSARQPLEVLLVGLPALEACLADPALAALRQRVSVRATLAPLSDADTQRYVQHRVAAAGGDGPGLFSKRTCREIAARTHGVPRQVNALAGEALRIARAAAQPTVKPEHVAEAARVLWGVALAPEREAEPAAQAMADPVPGPAPRAGIASAPALQSSSAPATPPRPAAPRPAPQRAVATPEREEAPRAEVPVTHDAKEWVARFVGDRGPLQLSAQVLAHAGLEREALPSGEGDEAHVPAIASRPAPRAKRRARPGWRRAPRFPVGGALALLACAAVVAFVAWRGTAPRAATHRTPAPRVAAAVPVQPVQAVVFAPARPEVRVVPAAATPAPVALAPAAVAVRVTPADEGASHRRYTIDAGGYLQLARARERRDQLRRATGIDAWVVTSGGGGSETYRIVLGIFRSPEKATAAADVLLGERTVGEASVIPLPPRRERQ